MYLLNIFLMLINTSFINYHGNTVQYISKSIKLYNQLIKLENDQTENIKEFFTKIKREKNKIKYNNTSVNNNTIKLLWNDKIIEFNNFIKHSNVILNDMENTISLMLNLVNKNTSISENKKKEFIVKLIETESKRNKVLLEILSLKSHLIYYERM